MNRVCGGPLHRGHIQRKRLHLSEPHVSPSSEYLHTGGNKLSIIAHIGPYHALRRKPRRPIAPPQVLSLSDLNESLLPFTGVTQSQGALSTRQLASVYQGYVGADR